MKRMNNINVCHSVVLIIVFSACILNYATTFSVSTGSTIKGNFIVPGNEVLV